MADYLRQSWRLARGQMFSLLLLFLFHLTWSILFYRFVQARVIAVMERFPPAELGNARFQLFASESSLLLEKSDLATPVLWMLLVYVAGKLLLTPILYAGVYTSLLNPVRARGTIFFEGMRSFGGSFIWLYLLRLALTALPFYWAAPSFITSLNSAASVTQLLLSLAPWLIGIALYGGTLKLLFTHLQFALIENRGLLSSLAFSLRHLPRLSMLACAICGIAIASGAVFYSISLYWAGFLSIIIYLMYPLVQIGFRIWAIAAQYEYWESKTSLRNHFR